MSRFKPRRARRRSYDTIHTPPSAPIYHHAVASVEAPWPEMTQWSDIGPTLSDHMSSLLELMHRYKGGTA